MADQPSRIRVALVGFALILVLFAATSIASLQPFSLHLRAFAIGLLISAGLGISDQSKHARRSAHTGGLKALFIGNILFLCAASVPIGVSAELIQRVGAAILVWVALYSAWPVLTSRAGARAIGFILGVFVLWSLAVGALIPSIGQEQDRLRGLTENANLLGWLASLTVLLVASYRRVGWIKLGTIGGALAAVVMTASRASATALVIAFFTTSAIKLRYRIWTLWIAGVASVTAAMISLVDVEEVTLLRSENSREGSIEATLRVLRTSFWFGDGLSFIELPVASSPLAATIQGGAFGLLGFCISAIGILLIGVRSSAVGAALAIVSHAFFENWVLAPTGPIFLVTLITLAAIRPDDATKKRDSRTMSGFAPLQPQAGSASDQARSKSELAPLESSYPRR